MTEVPKTVWVTKYALSDGLKEAPLIKRSGDYVSVKWSGVSYGMTLSQNDWHPTREAAVSRANEMKAAKIASLRRQIERLESLEF